MAKYILNKFRKVELLIFFTICTNYLVIGQDPVLSQYFSQPLELNSGLTGNTGGTRVIMNYRNQWPSLSANYVTYGVSADSYFENIRSGVGISLVTDDAAQGILKTINFDILYSYQLDFGDDNILRMGLQLGLIRSNLDFNKLIFGDAIDPIQGPFSPGGTPFPTKEALPDLNKNTKLDMGFGVFFNNPKAYIGLGLKHLNRPETFFYSSNIENKRGLPIRGSIMAGYRIDLNDKSVYNSSDGLAIMPSILVVKHGYQGQLNIGAQILLNKFSLGLFYRQAFRNIDAAILYLGFEKNELHIGYSYDLTISKLSINSGGAHELSVSFIFNKDNGSKYNDCTKIFK